MGNLQAAIEEAAKISGQSYVLIKEGTYKPTTGTNRSISFSLRNEVSVIGGFVGTETTLGPKGGKTILSGNIGNQNLKTDNTYRVIELNPELGLNYTAKLQNVTITDGYNSGGGGGMYINSCNPVLRKCRIENNLALNGAGIYLGRDSRPIIIDCSFVNNTATNVGGAIAVGDKSSDLIWVRPETNFSGNNSTTNPNRNNFSFPTDSDFYEIIYVEI